METRPAAPSSPSIPRRLAPLALAIILVALGAGFVSGSCTAVWDGGLGTAVIAALIAASIALAVGLLFLILTSDRRELWFYAVNGVAAYIAAEFGAWFLLLWPAIVALLIVIAGGIVAGWVARKAFRAWLGTAGSAGIISAFAIAISAVIVVASVSASFFSSDFTSSRARDNYIPFAVIAGSVPPVLAAIAARIAGLDCRRGQPPAGNASDDSDAGQR